MVRNSRQFTRADCCNGFVVITNHHEPLNTMSLQWLPAMLNPPAFSMIDPWPLALVTFRSYELRHLVDLFHYMAETPWLYPVTPFRSGGQEHESTACCQILLTFGSVCTSWNLRGDSLKDKVYHFLAVASDC